MRFMGVGTGPIAPPEVARVTMLLRANCLSKGNSGVRVELVERLLDLLNNDVLPFIPERGSCGASGDLAPLSYVGRALSGDGGSRSTVRAPGRRTCSPSSASNRSCSRPRRGWR